MINKLIFDERSLREEIIKVWGKYGAHLEVFDMLLQRAAFQPSVFQPVSESEPKEDGWIRAEDGLPQAIEGKDYSENVFAIVEGIKEIKVMSRGWVRGVDENDEDIYGPVWCDCGGNILGDGEFDDDYKVTHWRPLPSNPVE